MSPSGEKERRIEVERPLNAKLGRRKLRAVGKNAYRRQNDGQSAATNESTSRERDDLRELAIT